MLRCNFVSLASRSQETWVWREYARLLVCSFVLHTYPRNVNLQMLIAKPIAPPRQRCVVSFPWLRAARKIEPHARASRDCVNRRPLRAACRVLRTRNCPFHMRFVITPRPFRNLLRRNSSCPLMCVRLTLRQSPRTTVPIVHTSTLMRTTKFFTTTCTA